MTRGHCVDNGYGGEEFVPLAPEEFESTIVPEDAAPKPGRCAWCGFRTMHSAQCKERQ